MGHRERWPADAVYVGMPCDASVAFGIPPAEAGVFGKPWRLKDDPRGWPAAYVEHLVRRLLREPSFEALVRALSGKLLLCWCTSKQAKRGVEVPCHARILAEFVDLLNS